MKPPESGPCCKYGSPLGVMLPVCRLEGLGKVVQNPPWRASRGERGWSIGGSDTNRGVSLLLDPPVHVGKVETLHALLGISSRIRLDRAVREIPQDIPQTSSVQRNKPLHATHNYPLLLGLSMRLSYAKAEKLQ